MIQKFKLKHSAVLLSNSIVVFGIFGYLMSGVAYAADMKSDQVSTVVSLVPYAGDIKYNSTTKIDRDLYGIYGYVGVGQHSVELGFDNLKSKNQTVDPLDEDHTTLIYTNYQIPSVRLKIGGHQMNAGSLGKANTFLLGGAYDYSNTWGYKEWGVGLDVSRTRFDSTLNQRDVNQFTLTGIKYWAVDSAIGSYVSLWGNVYQINLSQAVENKSNYTQGKVGVSYHKNNLDTGIYVREGDSPYVVDKGGFVLYDDNTINKDATGVMIAYQFLPKFNVKLEYEQSNQRDFNTATTNPTIGVAKWIFTLSASF
jgi:hypothetical protein